MPIRLSFVHLFNTKVFLLWKLFPYTYYFKPTSTCLCPPNLGLSPDSKELWGLIELKELSGPFYARLLLCHKGLCSPVLVLCSFLSVSSGEIVSAVHCLIASTHSHMLEYLLNSPWQLGKKKSKLPIRKLIQWLRASTACTVNRSLYMLKVFLKVTNSSWTLSRWGFALFWWRCILKNSSANFVVAERESVLCSSETWSCHRLTLPGDLAYKLQCNTWSTAEQFTLTCNLLTVALYLSFQKEKIEHLARWS